MRNSVLRSSRLPFFLVVVLLSPLHAQQSPSEILVGQTDGNIQHLVVGLENQVLQGYVQKNRGTVAPLLADDFQDVGEYGVWDKERSLQEIADPTSLTQSASMSQVHFSRLAPTVVLLTYKLAEIEIDHGVAVPSTKYISSVWVYRDGRWLNVLGQDTPATSTPLSARPSDSDFVEKEKEIQGPQKQSDWSQQTPVSDPWIPPKNNENLTDLAWLVGSWRIEKHYSHNPFMKGKHLVEAEQCAPAIGGYYVICNSLDTLDNGKPVRETVVWSQDVEPHVLRFVDTSPDDSTDRPTAGWCRIDGVTWYCYAEPKLENGKTIHLRFVTRNTPSSARGGSQFSEDGIKWLPLSDDSFTKVQ